MIECNNQCRTSAEHLERHASGLGCMGEEFTKHDAGKARYDLIPMECIELLAEQLTAGAAKYRPDNWKKGSPEKYYSAFMRHYAEIQKGNRIDKNGLPHAGALMANAMFLAWFFLQTTPSTDQ